MRASWGTTFEVYTRNNVLATQQLLEACVAAGVPKVVYASSSSVYGDQDELPLREDMAPRPRSPYGVTKLAGEHLCLLYHANHGLDTVSLRFFTVYGPRQRPDMAFHKFIRAMLEGREIVMYGDGTQTRDFTYVDDIVEGLVLAQKALARRRHERRRRQPREPRRGHRDARRGDGRGAQGDRPARRRPATCATRGRT